MSDRDYPASNQRVHELKVWPAYFAALADGRKTFEIRRNDRGYQVGDVLALREWRPDLVPGSGDYTGRSLTRVVTYITDFEQMQGIVVMGLAGVAPEERTHHKLDTDKQVFFYEQDFYVLSNFSAFSLKWCGLRFDTSEAAYHWEKFTAHPQIQQYIFCARSAHEAFKLAETYKHLRRSDWDRVKVEVMRDILRAKVEQHEYVHRKLLETGDRELIEDSWRDDFWGWGPNRDGQNMLGKLWMEVRAELRAATETPAERKP